MKIGTWNLDAHWNSAHEELLINADCDVWLLTEVSPSAIISGYQRHFSKQCMARGQHYSAIFSRMPLNPIPDPHPASAAALIDDVTYCCSILPWSTCAHDPLSPWAGGASVEGMVRDTIDSILESVATPNLVWGGDWNQNLIGGWENVGSGGGRSHIECAVRTLDLKVPTANLLHRLEGSHTIDQIAVPKTWNCHSAVRIEAAKLSDHDVYTIKVEPRT